MHAKSAYPTLRAFCGELGQVPIVGSAGIKTHGKSRFSGRSKAAQQTLRKRDREDLYTDNWNGSEWKGALPDGTNRPRPEPHAATAPQNLGTERQLSGMRVVQAGGTSREHQICRMTLACVVRYAGSQFNILNVILVVSVLTPLLGIAFALWSYGTLWG